VRSNQSDSYIRTEFAVWATGSVDCAMLAAGYFRRRCESPMPSEPFRLTLEGPPGCAAATGAFC